MIVSPKKLLQKILNFKKFPLSSHYNVHQHDTKKSHSVSSPLAMSIKCLAKNNKRNKKQNIKLPIKIKWLLNVATITTIHFIARIYFTNYSLRASHCPMLWCLSERMFNFKEMLLWIYFGQFVSFWTCLFAR